MVFGLLDGASKTGDVRVSAMADRWKRLIGLIGVILLAYGAFLTTRDSISKDLTERSQQALAEAQIGGVGVAFPSSPDTRYRIAYLSGDVDMQTRSKAIEAVSAVHGVHQAQWLQDPALAEGDVYEWRAQYLGGKVTLSGVVPDDQTKAMLLARAKQMFEGADVIDRMSILDSAPEGDWAAAAQVGIDTLSKLQAGEASLSDTILTVTGTTDDRSVAQIIEDSLMTNLPRDYHGRPGILMESQARPAASDGTLPTPEIEPAVLAQVNTCQEKIIGAMEGKTIEFEIGSSALRQNPDPLLDSIAAIAVECPGAAIEIQGHTDSVGSETANVRLSEQRAKSVLSYLLAKGIASNRLKAVGYGESQPLDPSDTDAAREKNRRIQFAVSATP
jgi:outer membrane protein OmpA-like peptidoglycan-associated protein